MTGLENISDSPKKFNVHHAQKDPSKCLRSQARSVLQKRIQALRDYTRAQLYLLEERRLRKTSNIISEKDFLVEYEQTIKLFQKKKREIKLEFNSNVSQEVLSRHSSETCQMQLQTILLQRDITMHISDRKPISKPTSPIERFTTKFVNLRDISRRSSLLFDRDLSGTGTELLDDIPNCTSFLELSHCSHSPIPFHQKILPPSELLDEPLKNEVARHAKRIWSHYTEMTTLPEVSEVDDSNDENINNQEFVSRNFVAHWCLELSKNLVQSLPNPRAALLLKNFDAFSKHLESVILFSSSSDSDGALEPHLQSVQKLARKRSHLQLHTNRILAACQLYDRHTSWLELDVIKFDREICNMCLIDENKPKPQDVLSCCN